MGERKKRRQVRGQGGVCSLGVRAMNLKFKLFWGHTLWVCGFNWVELSNTRTQYTVHRSTQHTTVFIMVLYGIGLQDYKTTRLHITRLQDYKSYILILYNTS